MAKGPTRETEGDRAHPACGTTCASSAPGKESHIVVDRKFGHMVRTSTQSNIELKPHYSKDDIRHLSYDEDLGDPGTYPFTSGLYPEMYRDRLC